jgi:Zn-dependent peptidase ImmA (M78 family)
MNTTKVGDRLETAIYDLLKSEIEADRFLIKKQNCKLYRKKSYYSKDREKEITFDISIEAFLPGATEYSLLILVECKNYSHSVPVDDAEEFCAKVDQVASRNGKAIIAATASFQSSTRTYAKTKGIALLRYFDPSNFKWELRRSPSASAVTADALTQSEVEAGITLGNFESTAFDLYLQSPFRLTNSLWDCGEDLLRTTSLTPGQRATMINSKSRLMPQVPFREKELLEADASEILSRISYVDGRVDLDVLCVIETQRRGLTVIKEVAHARIGSRPALGRIRFEPLEIEVFAQPEANVGRSRFTLAHELAHHLLGHGEYMIRESCDEYDFVLIRRGVADPAEIGRMEFQANYFAASLLMPRSNFVEDFLLFVRTVDLANKGFGALYVDDQKCNLETYYVITTQLMERYNVSRAAATIRLQSLGMLVDARSSTVSSAAEILSSSALFKHFAK